MKYLPFFRGQNCYANAPQLYVTPTYSLPKYTNDRTRFELPRQSMYILNSDQTAGHYCNKLQHCEGFRSLATALQSVEQKFISLNWKEGGNLNLLLIVCLFTFISFTFFTALCYRKLSAVFLQTHSPLSLSLLSHPPLHFSASHCTNVYRIGL